MGKQHSGGALSVLLTLPSLGRELVVLRAEAVMHIINPSVVQFLSDFPGWKNQWSWELKEA